MTIVCIYLFKFGICILDKHYIVECEFLDSKLQFSSFDIFHKSNGYGNQYNCTQIIN